MAVLRSICYNKTKSGVLMDGNFVRSRKNKLTSWILVISCAALTCMFLLEKDKIESSELIPLLVIIALGVIGAALSIGMNAGSPYTVRHVHSLALMQADTIDYTYKSAGREPLNCLFALRGACDDILIVKQGLLTDTSIANIALSDGTHWYTPAHPLLKGTKRAALLEEGILQEKDIRPEDLPSFSTVRLFNAMIDWGELELPVRNIIP